MKLRPVREPLVAQDLGESLPLDLDAAVLQYAIQRVNVHIRSNLQYPVAKKKRTLCYNKQFGTSRPPGRRQRTQLLCRYFPRLWPGYGCAR